jgi:hypothetical protein
MPSPRKPAPIVLAGLLLAGLLLAGTASGAQTPASANPAPCTVAPQPQPCGAKPAPSTKPSAVDRFPFPGEPAAAPTPKPDSPTIAPAPKKSAADAFPFPGEDPAISAGASSSSSSSSSSAGDTNPDADPTAAGAAPTPTTPALDDKGSDGTPQPPGRHLLHRVNPIGTKLQDNDEREAEDLDVAHFYTQTGDIQGAYLRSRDAVKLAPDDPDAHFALAEAARKLNKRDEAIAEYTACLNHDPTSQQASAAHKAIARLKP